jgi:hypothetical protein
MTDGKGLRELWSDRFAEECWMASQEYRGKAKDRMRCDAVGVNATGTRGPSKMEEISKRCPWEPAGTRDATPKHSTCLACATCSTVRN